MDFEHGMSLLSHRLTMSSPTSCPTSAAHLHIDANRRSFQAWVCEPEPYPGFSVLSPSYLQDILWSDGGNTFVALAMERMLIEQLELLRAHIAVPLSVAIRDCYYKRLHVFPALCIQTGSAKSIARRKMYRRTCNLLAGLFHAPALINVGRRALLENSRVKNVIFWGKIVFHLSCMCVRDVPESLKSF